MLNVYVKAGLSAFLVAIGLATLTWRWVETAHSEELAALSERSAVALDLQFSIWKTALSSLASSHSMMREFDAEILRWEAERLAMDLGGWIVLMPADDQTVQIFNTLRPGSSRLGPASPELTAAIERSRRSGLPEMSDIFFGRVSQRPIVAVVQYVTGATGKGYILALGFEAAELSSTLQGARLPDGYFISVVDGSNRVVARSSEIEDFFLRPLPEWFVAAVRAAPADELVILRGEPIAGNAVSEYVFARHALASAPGWGISVASPPSVVFFTPAFFIPSLGFLLFFGFATTVGTFQLTSQRRQADLEAAFAQSVRERALREEKEQALAELRVAESARADMLGVLGHEMRTPVLSAIAALRLFPPALKAQDQGASLDRAEKGLELLQSLIEDVLDLSQMKVGALRLNNKAFSMPKVLEEVVEIMLPVAERHKLAFESDWTPGEMQVVGDSTRIRQILVNLLSNAFKYTSKGVVKLRGSWQIEEEGSCLVVICVSDTGSGISSNKFGDVFKPFVRLDQGSNDRVSGLGLGLPISQRLATAMGGRIDVTSRVGLGSSFCLTLNLPVFSDTGNDASTPEEAEDINLEGLRILVVEDQPLQGAFVVSDLRKMQSTVSLATTGEEALRLAQLQEHDVILIDLGLPDMSGLDLIRNLKNRESHALHIAFSANPSSLSVTERQLFDAVAKKTGKKNEVCRIVHDAISESAEGN